MAADLKDLRKAPAADPTTVPPCFSGRPPLSFHEVLAIARSHASAMKMKDITFTKKVDQKSSPNFSASPTIPIHELAE